MKPWYGIRATVDGNVLTSCNQQLLNTVYDGMKLNRNDLCSDAFRQCKSLYPTSLVVSKINPCPVKDGWTLIKAEGRLSLFYNEYTDKCTLVENLTQYI